MQSPILEAFAPSEIVFQSYTFPLADFVAANSGLHPSELRAVRLVFDRTPRGVVVLEDVGFRAPPGEPAP
jgi:hypothetical protein